MELAEGEQTTLEIIYQPHSVQDTIHYCQSMFLHLRRARAQVCPVGEVRLRLRVNEQSPERIKTNNNNEIDCL